MEERQVTIEGDTRELPVPFLVLATQNPVEYEGTYPLPEAQLDRFMFHIVIEHPPEEEELEVVRTTTAIIDPHFERPVSGADLIAFQRLVRRVPVADLPQDWFAEPDLTRTIGDRWLQLGRLPLMRVPSAR